jgi:glycosyltransferase involved in cell wall biosynthesis
MLVNYKDREDNWIKKIASNEAVFDSSFSNYLKDQERIGGWLDFSKISLIQYKNFMLLEKSNIIHLHNLHGGYFSYALLPYLSRRKKMIWTLHDEHVLTGHCSFSMTCEKWKDNCLKCDFLDIYPAIQFDNTKALRRYKERWIKKSNITFVTPSYWLSNRLKEAYPFIQDIHVIQNGIDISLFIKQDQKESRKKFNLPYDKFIVLFVAEYSTNNPFKGGETIRELIKLNSNHAILFVTVGGKTTEEDSNFIEIPYIKNEEDLASLYSACDLMLYPTNADNHPLVVMESMSCELPVLAPEIGGIPEIISPNIDGWLVDAYSKPAVYLEMLTKIYDLKLKDEAAFCKFGNNARNKIELNFTQEQMFKKYEDLYSIV